MCSGKSCRKSSETASAGADDWPNTHFRALAAVTEQARALGLQLRWTGSMAEYLRQYREAEK
jgi:hypothetical protein